MPAISALTRSNFIIKLKSWEYWPFGIVQFPLFIYFFWLSIKARSFLFFSASNPTIPMGGMFGESKYDILKRIPAEKTPRMAFVKAPKSEQEVLEIMERNRLVFPVIFKPDIGERGYRVKKIANPSEVSEYVSNFRLDFIIQEFADLPLEFGVFYTRFPNEDKGRVTSIVGKEMLFIVGDGTSTIKELILRNDRAKLQWEKLKHTYAQRLDEIIPIGDKLELVSIGNHALGTKFLDRTDLINMQVSNAFDKIGKQINGFYFGRFDLRCRCIEDLSTGNVTILELNGCGAEPAHIYQPGYSIFKAVRVLFYHWQNIYKIARQNRKKGIRYISFLEGVQFYKKFKKATR